MIRKLLLILTMVFLAVSCVITEPTPLIGSFMVLSSDQSNSPHYMFRLYENGKFVMIQSGEDVVSKAYIMKGNYSVDLNAFDFINASGVIEFRVTEHNFDKELTNTVFSVKDVNRYDFYWYIPDRDVQSYRMELKPKSDVCKKLGNCFSMSDESFELELAKEEAKK